MEVDGCVWIGGGGVVMDGGRVRAWTGVCIHYALLLLLCVVLLERTQRGHAALGGALPPRLVADLL